MTNIDAIMNADAATDLELDAAIEPVQLESAAETATGSPAPAAPTPTPAPSGSPSIRTIIRSGLLAGQSTATIAATVKAHHPNSAAAAKSVKHIAFYRCQMRKAGELAAYVRPTA